MSNVIEFKSRQDREFEQKVSELMEMFKLIREQNEKSPCQWVMMNEEGYIKVVSGNLNVPHRYRLPIIKPLNLSFSANTDTIESMQKTYREFVPDRWLNKDRTVILFREI